MAKRVKFALEMANGVKVRDSLEELRDNYDEERVEEYFFNGELLKWLEDRYYEEEADNIREIDPEDEKLSYLLAHALGMIEDEEEDMGLDAEQLERLKEKKEILSRRTDDESIIANADRTALNQADLADLLDMKVSSIYLCGDKFTIPLKVSSQVYIGILGTPNISIRAKSQADVDAQQIVFKNVRLPWGEAVFDVASGENLADKKAEEICVNKLMEPNWITPTKEKDGEDDSMPVDELKALYNAATSSRCEEYGIEDEIWEHVTINDGDYIDSEFDSVAQKMVLRMICKNKFKEDEVAHACINQDMSGGFVLTTKAICIYDKYCFRQDGVKTTPTIIIPYKEIKNVTEKCITLKDDSSIWLAEQRSYKEKGCWFLTEELSSYLNAVIDYE